MHRLYLGVLFAFFTLVSFANDVVAVRSITSSSERINQSVSKAFDDDFNTFWEAADSNSPQWIEVEFEHLNYFTKVQQIFNQSSVWAFIIEGSRDGQDWIQLVDHSKGIAGISFAESIHGFYKYIRITIISSSDNYAASSREFSVTAIPKGINILQYQGKVEVQTELPNYEAAKIMDNDLSTYWVAANGSYPQVIYVDLEESFHVTNVQQVFKDYDNWKYKIEASEDNVKWTTIVDKSSGEIGCEFNNNVDGSYQYFRFTILGSVSYYWANSCELRVLGYKEDNPLKFDYINKKSLTLNVRASASSIKSKTFSQHKAVDSDTTTAWYANESESFPQWLMVDLKNACDISRVEQTFADDDNWRFLVEGSLNKQSWDLLLDVSAGWEGTKFSQAVSGLYRYIKITILGSNQHTASSKNFQITGLGMPVSTRWWQNESGLTRYYTKLYGYTLEGITADLDNLKSQGYNVLELMCPYEGPADIWAGLGATNNYDIDPSIGTMADFEELIREAHERDMKIVFFGNVGYCRDDAPFFQKACEDEFNDVYSKERKWFHFSKIKYNDRWFWSSTAQAYYYSYWGNTDGANGRIPSYNFNNQEWRDEVKKYLRFWVDKGLDGLFLDAPEVYDGINDEIIENYLANTLNAYDILTNSEGSSDIDRWFGKFNYNVIQGFDMYGWGGGKKSEVLNALHNSNPSGLNGKLKTYRDRATHMSGVTLTPPMWEIPANASERVFETAYLVSMGTLFANHAGDHRYIAQDIIPTWNSYSQDRYYSLVRMQSSYKGLSPSGQRTKLFTNDDNKYAAFKRTNKDGNVSALVIFNFQSQRQSISVNLYNSGIKVSQNPVNLLTGTAADPIYNPTYTVSLPANGFLMLGVENELGQKATPVGVEKLELENSLQVFPNPFANHLTVTSPKPLERITIYSMSGLIMREYNPQKASYFEIDNLNLQSGVYFLKAVDINKKEYVVKVVSK